MAPDEQPPDQTKLAQASLELAFKVLAQIGLVTFGVIFVSILAGLALDSWLNTKRLFTALLIVGSFPLMLYIIYRIALGAVARIPPAPRRAAPKETTNSDNDR